MAYLKAFSFAILILLSAIMRTSICLIILPFTVACNVGPVAINSADTPHYCTYITAFFLTLISIMWIFAVSFPAKNRNSDSSLLSFYMCPEGQPFQKNVMVRKEMVIPQIILWLIYSYKKKSKKRYLEILAHKFKSKLELIDHYFFLSVCDKIIFQAIFLFYFHHLQVYLCSIF